MTREDFVKEGIEKGFVNNQFSGLPNEGKLMGEILMDPLTKVIIVEREANSSLRATAYWRDPDAVEITDGRVSIRR